MMRCSICGKEDGIFRKVWACAYDDCNAAECKEHDGRVLEKCPDCGEYFCSAHIRHHDCNGEYNEVDDVGEETGHEGNNEENKDVGETGKNIKIKNIDRNLRFIEGDYEDVINSIDEILCNISRDNKITNIVPIINTDYYECGIFVFSELKEEICILETK